MFLGLLVVLLLGTAEPLAASEPSFQEIEESLTCQCGCGLTVHTCNHLQCPSAIPLRQEIRERMALGEDKDAILAHFANKYGEKILSSPTMSGFNLTAWIVPFAVIGVGALFVMFTLLRWRKHTGEPGGDTAPRENATAPSTRADLEKKLERELEDFDA